MPGSILIHAKDVLHLVQLADDMDQLESFEHIILDSLITLDFETICSSAKTNWSIGEPIALNEEAGVAIFQVSPQGLDLLLSKEGEFSANQRKDVSSMREFIKFHGKSHIYELATF